MSFRNILLTGFIAFALLGSAPMAVQAEEQQDAPAATAPDAESGAASDAAPAEAPAADSATDKEAAPADAASDEKAAAPEASDSSADSKDGKDAASNDADSKEAAAIRASLVQGPADVKLGDEAVVKMPKDFVFMPKEQGLAVMEQLGNHMDPDSFYGLFIPADENQKWFVAATFDDSGFVKDDDQSKIDADKILDGMKEGVKSDNEDRKAKGIPELDIVGWIEKPHYDSKTHHLIWSVEAKEVGGKDASTDNSVNYNTLALGRGGYISLNLVSSRSTVESDKKQVAMLLDNLTFNDGKKYENFDPKTDKIAEYGLIALIGGLAAKKIGLFALVAAVAAKSIKALVVAAVAGAAAVKKFFKRNKNPTV